MSRLLARARALWGGPDEKVLAEIDRWCETLNNENLPTTRAELLDAVTATATKRPTVAPPDLMSACALYTTQRRPDHTHAEAVAALAKLMSEP